ncbi:uncharacterized protein LOC129895003 [Solanum dulcamara]|uniref:uncharacterized protein LOC129895003 n=1 Tax=Solanum dulcamara TaxID=45834 RepID=UPI002485F1C4|nr:uncharacterized protein LOC129895003 [Solanum dulcamara]
MKKNFFKVSNSSSIAYNQPNREENANHLEVSSLSSQEFDLSSLKADPDERTQILEFHPNHRDAIRRAYLQKKPCQPLLREFSQIEIYGDMRRFNRQWFEEFPDWLEYSKQSNQDKHGYRIHLAASVDVVRLLVKQDLAFRVKNAPQNDQMTYPKIQKEIVITCKNETIKGIIKELNGDYFSLLVDESFDVSHKEQMAVVLQYVDRRGFVIERLLDIVHVKNTSVLSLKDVIVNLLSQHSLSLSYVRGQCYDGASNMQGDINGLKMLIKKETRLAYSIHYFAHQLQLTLVGVSKKCLQVRELVHLVSDIFNVLAASYKRMDEYRES